MGFSLLRVVINTGAAIGPLLANILLERNLAYIFFLNSFCSLLFAIFVFFKINNDKIKDQQEDIIKNTNQSSPWLLLLKKRNFWFFNLAMFLSSIVYMQLFATVPLAIKTYGYSFNLYSYLLVVYSIITILLELKVSNIASKFPSWIPSTIGTTILCLGVASFAITIHFNYFMLFSSFILVMGVMTSGPVMFAYPAKQDLVIRRKYISTTQACFSLGNAVGPILGISIFKSHQLLVFMYCAIIGIICAILLILGMKPKNK